MGLYCHRHVNSSKVTHHRNIFKTMSRNCDNWTGIERLICPWWSGQPHDKGQSFMKLMDWICGEPQVLWEGPRSENRNDEIPVNLLKSQFIIVCVCVCACVCLFILHRKQLYIMKRIRCLREGNVLFFYSLSGERLLASRQLTVDWNILLYAHMFCIIVNLDQHNII